MIDISDNERRRIFSIWLRTGRLAAINNADGVELKFNPWHDPQNGRFTFVGAGWYYGRGLNGAPARRGGKLGSAGADVSLDPQSTGQIKSPRGSAPVGGRGSNSRAFEDPMTLEQVFPGLRNSPAGTIVAVAENWFDLNGPANAAQIDIIDNHAQAIIGQIKAVDANWRFDELGPNTSVQGRANRLNDLRWQRATVLFRLNGDAAPLQIETLRFVQQQVDRAYDRGRTLLEAGRLKPRLSGQEALGNYVDARVRLELRERFNHLGIDSAGSGPVRVNRRENISSGGDLTYRRPDARIADVAFDVTLAEKTIATAQVRGFFQADFKPARVIIIRPRQVGGRSTYAITRPETKR